MPWAIMIGLLLHVNAAVTLVSPSPDTRCTVPDGGAGRLFTLKTLGGGVFTP